MAPRLAAAAQTSACSSVTSLRCQGCGCCVLLLQRMRATSGGDAQVPAAVRPVPHQQQRWQRQQGTERRRQTRQLVAAVALAVRPNTFLSVLADRRCGPLYQYMSMSNAMFDTISMQQICTEQPSHGGRPFTVHDFWVCSGARHGGGLPNKKPRRGGQLCCKL
jgi:hypothetical protein